MVWYSHLLKNFPQFVVQILTTIYFITSKQADGWQELWGDCILHFLKRCPYSIKRPTEIGWPRFGIGPILYINIL